MPQQGVPPADTMGRHQPKQQASSSTTKAVGSLECAAARSAGGVSNETANCTEKSRSPADEGASSGDGQRSTEPQLGSDVQNHRSNSDRLIDSSGCVDIENQNSDPMTSKDTTATDTAKAMTKRTHSPDADSSKHLKSSCVESSSGNKLGES